MLDIETLASAVTDCARLASALLAALCLAGQDQKGGDEHGSVPREAGSAQDAAAPAPDPHAGPLVFLSRPGAPPALFPRDETLVYEGHAVLSLFSASGTVTQVCTVAEIPPPLLATGPVQAQGEVAAMRLSASGSYVGYDLDSTLETRVYPRDWPRVVYTQNSKGNDERRREVQLGLLDGVPTSSYRSDRKNGASEGPRIWRDDVRRQVPPGTFDMLTCILLTRTLISEGKSALTFPLVDKDRLWQLTLKRGEEKRMETAGAGTFDVVEVVLDPRPFPGEGFEKGDVKNFEGVFGIKGKIHLWVEKHSGVVVRIQGDIPVNAHLLGTLTIGVDVLLKSYKGTPREFQPVPAEK